MGVPRPGGRQSGVAKRFGGRLGDLGALHNPNGEDQRGADPGERQRAAAGNTFLAATDSALNDPQKRAALQDYLQRLAGAERWAYANLDSYGKTLGEIIRFPAEIARAQFANRQSQWQPLAEETVAQQQATADFYLANGLIRTRLDVKPTFDRRFSVPAAEVTP